MTMSKGDVREESLIEENAGLLDESDVLADPLLVNDPHGLAINLDVTRQGLVKVGDEVSNRALSRTALPDEKCDVSGREE